MLSIISLFGGLISKLFSNWRVLALVCLILLGGYGYYKWTNVNQELQSKITELKTAKEDNETLSKNNETLALANKQNETIILQLKLDAETNKAQVKDLNTSLSKSAKTISGLKKQLDEIKEPPTKISPFIAQAIKGIQERDK